MRYLYMRGEGVKRRVAHLASYSRTGDMVGALCGYTKTNTSCNLPLGLKVCKNCLKILRDERATP